jgi:anthranilate phosphoribosyltransferase
VNAGQPTWFPETLAALIDRRDLTASQMRLLVEDVMAGHCGEAETAALLIALRMKGETALEIAAAATVLREHMIRLDCGPAAVLDTSGTGGDSSGTFNISTAAALVVAGAGVPVVKHGNRAISGRTGSADVLTALGVKTDGDARSARRCLEAAGMAFCFAPHFHPALGRVAALRRRLAVRTVFNCLGPLANPAGACYQLIGVGRRELLDPLAYAMAQLGPRRALLVHGRDGLDEVSLAGPTYVREVSGSEVREWVWTPADFGLAPCSPTDFRVDGPPESAALVRSVLEGNDGPAVRIVLANAAAALLAAERVTTLPEGVKLASDALAGGKALQVLQKLVECSHSQAEERPPGERAPGT